MGDEAPAVFEYRREVITEDEERALVAGLARMAFGAVAMRGQVARRRTAHFGWVYGYESWRITPGPPIPELLAPLRDRIAAVAGVGAAALPEALVTEYPAGAGIGWHRDAPQFGIVIGVSLLGACRMRFQRGRAPERQTCAVTLAPRSMYLLTGEARHEWQHSIPPIRTPRYSITFRTLKAGRQPG